MATVTRTYMVDDIDGSTADIESVQFSIDKHDYEIDLSPENASRLRERLEKYIGAAAPVKPAKRAIRKQVISGPVFKEQTAAIRHWARENGFEVSERGRIPSNVREAFEAAH